MTKEYFSSLNEKKNEVFVGNIMVFKCNQKFQKLEVDQIHNK